MALVWEFCRQIDPSGLPGNTTSYQDESAQTFFERGGFIRTCTGRVPAGQWEDVGYSAPVVISDEGYSVLDIEHHFTGSVFGSVQHGSDVVLIVYAYQMDVSDWLTDGSWALQPDNPIKTGSVTLKNADRTVFEDSATTIFAPGNRMRFRLVVGGTEYYDLGGFYIEASPYSDLTDAITFSGRNLIGFALASQTFDDVVEYSGTYTEIVTGILEAAGLVSGQFIVHDSTETLDILFADSDNYLSGLQTLCGTIGWYLDDLPDGRIIVGPEAFIKSFSATGIHQFNRGSEVVTRDVDRSADGVYSRVCVRRGGSTPRSVYAAVPYFDGWYLGTKRTYYQDVPDETTNAFMDSICGVLVEELQYSGIVETFLGPFRPWLQIGDVATVTGGDADRIVGIISDIQFSFGEGGYFTQFSVTSGGAISNPENPLSVATKYRGRMGGANRKRRLLDYISKAASSATGTPGAPGVPGGDGVGVPPAGSAGQALVKATSSDYDTEWGDVGDVVGPVESVIGNLPVFGTADGKTLQDSGIAPADFAAADHAHEALVNQRSGANPVKIWTGTQAQYDAIGAGNYDADALYFKS